MSLVAMTSASPAALLAMLEAIGLPAGEVAAPLDAPDPGGTSTGPPPLRSWYGEARVDHAVADPHAAVAAHLISHRLADVGPWVDIGVRLGQRRAQTLPVVAGAALGRPAAASLRAVTPRALASSPEYIPWLTNASRRRRPRGTTRPLLS